MFVSVSVESTWLGGSLCFRRYLMTQSRASRLSASGVDVAVYHFSSHIGVLFISFHALEASWRLASQNLLAHRDESALRLFEDFFHLFSC